MIYLATDHRGFQLKEKIKLWLKEWGYDYKDVGAFEYDPDDDYPDFVHLAAEAVSNNPAGNRAIIMGATGQGEAMLANRFKGVRAAVFYGGSEEMVRLSREHNDANILAIGAAPGSTIDEGRPVDEDLIKRAVKVWLTEPFSGDERHVRRIKKIDA